MFGLGTLKEELRALFSIAIFGFSQDATEAKADPSQPHKVWRRKYDAWKLGVGL